MLSLTTSLFAFCSEDTTNVIPLRIISNPPVSGNHPSPDHPYPHAPVIIPTIYVTIIADELFIDLGDFNEGYITLAISNDDNEILYINEMIQNTNTFHQVDISSLPIGVYSISIIDGDEEYIGEFEVF